MASIGNDVRHGSRTELDWLTGKVIALGKRLGLPTPANNFIYAALKLYKDGAPAA